MYHLLPLKTSILSPNNLHHKGPYSKVVLTYSKYLNLCREFNKLAPTVKLKSLKPNHLQFIFRLKTNGKTVQKI